MSDEAEKTCPLCAEEMDLTDQQLKPCKCGYQICVWCWHHIMDMAEKDDTEGRCPACRTPYNKEKVVGTAAKCERLVSEMSVEKKLKSQKGKAKTMEGRKQLGSVRVVQRNLVYVVGLPLTFADEDLLLQRKEYFAQYGKVLKVSISRTATGAIQQFANSTCSVYITYSKEEEAVRCIQSVHGFILDGRPLRACFGTTKYCHAWLRNVPCTNADCLYLHEIGSHEDSFTKDEIISAYTRSRVQQVTSSSITMQRRSGNVLPPPADEYCSNSSASSGKPIPKTAINTNNSASSARISPPNSSSGRSAALPAGASWGTRASSNQFLPTSTSSSNGPLKQKPDSCNGPVQFSPASSLQSDAGKKSVPDEQSTISKDNSKIETYEPVKKESDTDERSNVSESLDGPVHVANPPVNKRPHSPHTTKQAPDTTNIVNSSETSSGPALDEDSIDDTDGNMENVCSDILSMSIHENQQLQNGTVENIREAANTTEEVRVATVQNDFSSGHEMEDDLLSFHSQRIKDPEVPTNRVSDISHVFHLANHSSNNVDGFLDRQAVDRNNNLMVSTSSNFPSNGVEYSNLFPSKEKMSPPGRYEGEVVPGGAADIGESSIISNILSMDFDPWEESLTSPQDMVKLLGEADKRRQGSFGAPGPRRVQTSSSRSRFSFAREEEPSGGQVSAFGQSVDYFEQALNQRPSSSHDFSTSNNFHHHEQFGTRNGFPVFSGPEADTFPSSHSHLSSNKLSGSRSHISAPPGFSAPSRAPPPGFTSHERTEQFFETHSGNHMLDPSSSLLRNHYQTPSTGNNTFSNGDIEFMDPAILAVGKGTFPGGINGLGGFETRSSFSPQLNNSTYEEARFQSFFQRSSVPPHQNQRYTDYGDNFSNLGGNNNPYASNSSRVMEQTLSNNNLSPYSHYTVPQSRNGIASNGQWDGWNEAQNVNNNNNNNNNNLGMAELLRNERLGYNKFYGGYEDSKIRMRSSGNLYNGTYGI